MSRVSVVAAGDFAAAAAALLEAALRRALDEQGRASVALSGGSTPGPVYERWARAELGWSRVAIFFADERCVAPGDEASNYRLVRESLLAHLAPLAPLASGPPRVVRMEGEDTDFAAAAERYALELPERLDLAVLGMGSDGHTAALFPRSEAAAERGRRVVHVRGPKPPPDRLTLTPPVLAAAREKVLLVTGLEKAPMVRRALEGPFTPLDVPVQWVRDGAWILDEAAASELSPAVLDRPAGR